MSFSSNVRVSDKENYASVKVNPDIFSLEVMYSAAYTFLDRAWFIFDGDPDEGIEIKLKPKDGDMDPEKLALQLQNELINYSVYVIQASRNQDVRSAIISRALATNRVDTSQVTEESTGKKVPIGPSEDADYIEDPKGIAETWSPEKAEGVEEIEVGESEAEESET